jgi:malonyl-CoA/methylmalonyl-CoA synthetase
MPNVMYDALAAPHAACSRIFLTDDTGRRTSFAEFTARAAQMSHALTAAGLKPGGRVAVIAPKLADTLALYVGTLQAGGVYLPLNTAYTAGELEYFLTDATPDVVVNGAARGEALLPACRAAGAALLTLEADGSGTLSDAAAGQPEQFATVSRGADDLAALLYTSGTTGRSKGAMLTHGNMLSNAQALAALWQITRNDRLIHALPIFHTHGLFVAMNTSLLAGCQVRLMERFDAGAILAELPASTLLMGVPTFYTRLLGTPGFTREACANMRLFVSGSAPLLAETHEAFEARAGHRILERYGMTETNMNTSNPYDGERRAGTVGFPLPGTDVRITCPAEGHALLAGETGMIEVRGPNVFKGYWNMPEKTAEELRPDGWFITGDLGRFDDEGYLEISGRQKDLIISGGYNIYPKEIEDVLNTVPGILESAVVGLPDPDFGERVAAVIVPEPGADADVDALQIAASEQLARFKQPRSYTFLEALPRNTMGKVQKNLLRERLAVELG